MTFDVKSFRNDFPFFTKIKSIYFDNASTTQKPKVVLEALIDYYTNYNANVHRGTYPIAEKATNEYEKARGVIANFIKAKNEEIIFTKSTTESINIISNTLKNRLKANDEIIITDMEHHSNIIPWLELSKWLKVKIIYIPLLKSGNLNLEKFEKLISPKTKFISITHMSNVLGVVNNIEKIIKKAHNLNIEVLIDAAQSISHIPIDVNKIDCDYLVYSGHKIMGPTGIGVLYVKKNIQKKILPLLFGGQMIKEVTKIGYTYNDIPWKFEAGTPNIAQVIGLGAAISYFEKYDFIELHNHIETLYSYLIKQLNKINNITIYPNIITSPTPIISFNIKNVHGYDLTKLLGGFNICIRSGNHCAQPLVNSFNENSLNRISLYYYNTIDEIDFFINHLKKVISILK